jgi:hypothetical protein
MLVVETLIVIPRRGAEGGLAVGFQGAEVFGGEGAAVGNDQRVGRQRRVMSAENVQLFANAGVSVAVAVVAVNGDGQSAEVVDVGGDSQVHTDLAGGIAAREMCGRKT